MSTCLKTEQVCVSVCEREMSEFGQRGEGEAAGPAQVFNPYISLDRCARVRVCVCLYVQALISAFCLVCIPTLHKTLPLHQADNNQGGGVWDAVEREEN